MMGRAVALGVGLAVALAGALAAGARPVAAQAALAPDAPAVGGVVHSSAGTTLAFARVQVVGDTVASWSDEAGAYRLARLAAGARLIRVTHPGHEPLELRVTVPPDRGVRLDLTLEARPGPAPAPLAEFEPIRVEHTLPALLNVEQVTAAIQARYPEALVRRGVGGEAVLRLWLDEDGRVARGVVTSSTGQADLDRIALSVSRDMRFRPAASNGRPINVIVQIPVVFRTPARKDEG